MANTFRAIGSTAMSMAVVTWLCWPLARRSQPLLGVGPIATTNRITSALLNPVISPRGPRDPFIVAQIENPAEPVASNEQRAELEPEVLELDPATMLNTLQLNATFLQGNQNAAMINGRVYRQGEKLAFGETMDGEWIVKRVGHNETLVAYKDREFRLSFTGLDAVEVTDANEGAFELPATPNVFSSFLNLLRQGGSRNQGSER